MVIFLLKSDRNFKIGCKDTILAEIFKLFPTLKYRDQDRNKQDNPQLQYLFSQIPKQVEFFFI